MPPRGGRSYRQHQSFKKFIRERDNYTCQLCGEYGDQVDHIIPFSESHDSSPQNCRVLCKKCNVDRARFNMTKHLNGDDGAVIRDWERKADPHGLLPADERRARALELQRKHLSMAGRHSWDNRRGRRAELVKGGCLAVLLSDDRNRSICEARERYPELSLLNIGRAFGISWQRVHQILKKQAVAS